MFMPVGTVGSVKAIAPDDLRAIGARIILGNTYHLLLRPGPRAGRASWAACTSSSAGTAPSSPTPAASRSSRSPSGASITEEGVAFRSHLDGSQHLLTPEKRDADPAEPRRRHHRWPSTSARRRRRERALPRAESLARTTRWAQRLQGRVAAHDRRGPVALRHRPGRAAPGPARAARAGDLPRSTSRATRSAASRSARSRRRCTRASPARRAAPAAETKPRYLMGVGTPEDLLTCVARGHRPLRLRAAHAHRAQRPALHQPRAGCRSATPATRDDPRPPDDRCACYTCRTFTRAYLRHLFSRAR